MKPENHLNQSLKSVFLLFLLLFTSNSQYTITKLCSHICFCEESQSAIVCHDAKIPAIPTNIDSKFTKLTLQIGNFDSAFINKRNMTNLEHLTTLKIVHYNLKYISPHTFSDMKQLKILDLSNNKFNTIPPYAFQGLKLSSLHLMMNTHIQFSKQSFNGLRSKLIDLRSNNLNSIYFDLFELTGVNHLNLYNNSITTLDYRFRKLSNSYNFFIDLTDNPIHCDCSLSWLKNHLDKKINRKRSLNIKCKTPRDVYQKSLIAVSYDQLKCAPLEINEIQISFDNLKSQFVSFTCISTIGGAKVPKVSWLKVDSDYYRFMEYAKISSDKQSKVVKVSPKGDKVEVKNTLNLTVNEMNDTKMQLICSVTNDIDSTRRLEIQISNFRRLYKKANNTSLIKNGTNKRQKNSESNGYSILFERHFSLLELMVAIIGTFAVTFIGIMVIVKLVQYNTKKTIDYQATINKFRQQINQATTIRPHIFPTVPYDYSSTYSVPQDPYVFPIGYHMNEDSIYPVTTATGTTVNQQTPLNFVVN